MYLISFIFSLSLLSQSLQEVNPDSSEFTFTIGYINSDQGQIRIDVFNTEDGFLKKSFVSKTVQAQKGKMTISFEDLPDGEYTAFVLHDKNENGKLDMNKMGIPNEPYGMSENGKNRFGPPSYKKSIFKVDSNIRSLEITVD